MTTDTRQHFDSLLFDMDGTLWDAVDSYCAVWNAAIDRVCPRVERIGYDRLSRLMGTPLKEIYDRLIGTGCDYATFMDELLSQEQRLMPQLGGRLYPGVRETLTELARTHRLFMVSNCNAEGLPVFLEYTGLKPLFTDTISYGETGQEKDRNIALMVRRHGLEAPLYVGDTAGDCRCSHAAGVPFAWASYGFGTGVTDADYTLACISDLLKIGGI